MGYFYLIFIQLEGWILEIIRFQEVTPRSIFNLTKNLGIELLIVESQFRKSIYSTAVCGSELILNYFILLLFREQLLPFISQKYNLFSVFKLQLQAHLCPHLHIRKQSTQTGWRQGLEPTNIVECKPIFHESLFSTIEIIRNQASHTYYIVYNGNVLVIIMVIQ